MAGSLSFKVNPGATPPFLPISKEFSNAPPQSL